MRIPVLATLLFVAGCASQPQSQQPPRPAAAPAPVSTPSAAATADPAPPAEQALASNSPAQGFKPPDGYRVRMKGDTKLYCKKDTILGSRFAEEFCFTEDQLRDVVRRANDARQDKIRGTAVCTGGGPCGGT
jgi:hypothetical protein